MLENKCVSLFFYIPCAQLCSVKFNVPYHMIEAITQSKLCGLYENLVIAASALAATTIATFLPKVFFDVCLMSACQYMGVWVAVAVCQY